MQKRIIIIKLENWKRHWIWRHILFSWVWACFPVLKIYRFAPHFKIPLLHFKFILRLICLPDPTLHHWMSSYFDLIFSTQFWYQLRFVEKTVRQNLTKKLATRKYQFLLSFGAARGRWRELVSLCSQCVRRKIFKIPNFFANLKILQFQLEQEVFVCWTIHHKFLSNNFPYQ